MKKEFTMSMYSNKESLNAGKAEFLSRCSVIVRDKENHWFIIPHSKLEEWKNCMVSESYKEGLEPEYAERIEGVFIAFENYTLF